MPFDKLQDLIKSASCVGIKNFGELAEYKRRNKIKDNNGLLKALYLDAFSR